MNQIHFQLGDGNNGGKSEAEALYNEGNQMARRGEFESALELYERAIALDPSQPAFYNNRASVLKRLGRLEEALQQYEVITRSFPGFLQVYLALASTNIEIGNYDEAVNNYRHFLRAYNAQKSSFNLHQSEGESISNSEEMVTDSLGYLPSEQRELALLALAEARADKPRNPTVTNPGHTLPLVPPAPAPSTPLAPNVTVSHYQPVIPPSGGGNNNGLIIGLLVGGSIIFASALLVGGFLVRDVLLNSSRKPEDGKGAAPAPIASITPSLPAPPVSPSPAPRQTVPAAKPAPSVSRAETNGTIVGEPGVKSIRAGAGTNYPITTVGYPGERILVLGTGYDNGGYPWYRIYSPKTNTEGWIAAQLISEDGSAPASAPETYAPPSPENTDYAEVGGTAGIKNLRAGPGTRYSVVTQVYTGEAIEILDKAQDTGGYVWYKVHHHKSGVQGWIAAQLVNLR